MKKSFLIVSGLVLAALPLCARTVALWPLNWDATADKPSGACAIAAENNLSIHSRATFARDTTVRSRLQDMLREETILFP